MTCNNSGFIDPSTTKGWTIVDVDWSNAKAQWAAAKPMNCEELLIQQVEMTAAASPGTTSFVYRNAIKSLPYVIERSSRARPLRELARSASTVISLPLAAGTRLCAQS